MPAPAYTRLENRAIITLEGEDRVAFLQGLVSNDVARVSADCAVYAALLTPQGKFLHDMFVIEADGRFLIDCERDRLADLLRRLTMYKLRSKVALTDKSDTYDIYALYGMEAMPAIGTGTVYADPRLAAAGYRAILPRDGGEGALQAASLNEAPMEDYETLRISLGLADGSRDMVVDKAILLENGFDELNGVNWEKGCYMGQELTARTKYRGLIKKRLVPVTIDGPAPEPGTPIMAGEKEAGEMRSHAGNRGLALMRLDAMEDGGPFVAGEATITPEKPSWAGF